MVDTYATHCDMTLEINNYFTSRLGMARKKGSLYKWPLSQQPRRHHRNRQNGNFSCQRHT